MTRSQILPAAFSAVALSAALAAWGTYGDNNPSTREYLVIVAIVVASAAIVYGLVVPRALRSPAIGRTAVILSVLGFLTVAAFWSGLPPVLALAGVVLGWDARARTTGKVAVGIGVLALLADLAVYVADRM